MQSIDNSIPIQNKIQSMKPGGIEKLLVDNDDHSSSMTGTSSKASGSLAETEMLTFDPAESSSILQE